MQNGEGRPSPFYHVSDVSVYSGGERSPPLKECIVLHFEPGALSLGPFCHVNDVSVYLGRQGEGEEWGGVPH